MNCAEFHQGDVLVCEDCGLELFVQKECNECGEGEATCCSGPCTFSCCGQEMKLKKK